MAKKSSNAQDKSLITLSHWVILISSLFLVGISIIIYVLYKNEQRPVNSDKLTENEGNVQKDRHTSTATNAILNQSTSVSQWSAPDTASIPKNGDGKIIRYGRDLIAHTSVYLGPKGTVANISNGMSVRPTLEEERYFTILNANLAMAMWGKEC